MRAMVYRGPYRVRVEEEPIPIIEHPNDAIVRVTCGAICGSDLHLYHGLVPDTRVGMTFGHEFAGVVENIGSSVQNLQRGDPVLVPFKEIHGAPVPYSGLRHRVPAARTVKRHPPVRLQLQRRTSRADVKRIPLVALVFAGVGLAVFTVVARRRRG